MGSKKAPGVVADLKEKYFDVLRTQIIEPAKRDLLELRRTLDAGDKKGAGAYQDDEIVERNRETQLRKIDQAVEFLDAEFARLNSLKLGQASRHASQ